MTGALKKKTATKKVSRSPVRKVSKSGEKAAVKVIKGVPTQNFSKAAAKAATQFKGVKIAKAPARVSKKRAAQIERAFQIYYGIK